jgi:hypothetical protein
MMAQPERVADWPTKDRAELFLETAAKTRITSPVAVEKDYWICWTLDAVFAMTCRDSLVFKGGTSLSKAFDVVDRFSEDIDLSIDRKLLGLLEDDPGGNNSKSKAKKIISAIRGKCDEWVTTVFRAELQCMVADRITKEKIELKVDDDDKSTILFAYPQSLPRENYGQSDYIPPLIRLEMGARAEVWPVTDTLINSYCKTAFSDLVPDPPVNARTLAPERTFWEKATIAHVEYFRPPEKQAGIRHSRHYYDLAMLARTEIGRQALTRSDLRQAVVEHKTVFFPLAYANYKSAVPGTFRICPRDEQITALRADYARMREMFFTPPPPFDELMNQLAALEAQINNG